MSIFQNVSFLILLGAGIFLSTALPVVSFKNTETFQVGVRKTHIITDREEILTEDSLDRRELSIRLFYPSKGENDDVDEIPYIPDFEMVKEFYAEKIGWPSFLIDYLKYWSIEGLSNTSILENKKFPLVLYSHGLTNNYTEATGRLMLLASRGYVVVAINHTYLSNYSELQNGEYAEYKKLTFLGEDISRTDSIKTVFSQQWVDDAGSVIDELKKSDLATSINFENIGLMGFSAGGTMANMGSYLLGDVKASVNLDGTPRGIPFDQSAGCPQFFVFSEPVRYSDQQLEAWGITRSMVEDPVMLKLNRAKEIISNTPGKHFYGIIEGTKHSNMIEYPLISSYSNKLEIGGEIDSWYCYHMINELAFTFLDRELKNKEVPMPVYKEIKSSFEY